MSSQKSCGYLTSEIIFEIERVKEFAGKKDANNVENHLSLLESELEQFALHCGAPEFVGENSTLKKVREHMKNNEWDQAKRESQNFEKELIVSLASGHAEGGDHLDVIPARMWDSLDKY